MNTLYKPLAITVICIISFTLWGCKGSAGKKIATEAIELFESNSGAKKAATELVESEVTQVERQAEQKVTRQRRPYRPRHSSYDDEGTTYQPQPYKVPCTQCGGAGMVYMTDAYGNIQYDYYGNVAFATCVNCGGTGMVTVYQ